MHLQYLGILGKTWGLRSVLGGYPFHCLCTELSWEGSEVVGKFSFTVKFRASCWGFSSARYSCRSPLLLPVCQFSEPLFWWRFCGLLLLPQLLVMTVAPNFLDRTDFWRPVKSSPCLFICRLVTDKVSTGCLPSLRQDFWCRRLSSCSGMRRG